MNIKVARTRSEVEQITNAWKSEGKTIGFVPTMGALHEGHLSLVKIAQENANKIVVSIFVNPTQFGPNEDYSRYPRDERGDLEKLASAGVDLVYLPDAEEIYPHGIVADLKAGPSAQGLEGDLRPGHFDGVVSVVYRLFEHVKPNIAVFGEKDYQQLMVIKEMVEEKKLPVVIIPGPIMRDKEGLALSSRNAYLSTEELEIARKLNVILREAAKKISHPCEHSEAIQNSRWISSSPLPPYNDDLERLKEAKQKLLAAGFNEAQYIERHWNRVLAAVKIGKTRLIDNIAL